MNLEKAPGTAGHTGVNTHSGSQLTINLKINDLAQLQVIMYLDCFPNCSAAGCELLDKRKGARMNALMIQTDVNADFVRLRNAVSKRHDDLRDIFFLT